MNWKLKYRIQNLIAKLPANLSCATYYYFQRHWGGFRKTNPTSRLAAGAKIAEFISKQGQIIDSKTFLEIGTGHQLNLPISLWLCGAEKIITVDLNPYLTEELVFEDISYIRNHQKEIKNIFVNVSQAKIFEKRFEVLLSGATNLQLLFNIMNIDYLSPADATNLNLSSHTIDCCVSYTVLEHIPHDTLEQIFLEGRRIFTKEGLHIHCIDFSDHFSHSDHSIPPINFLQYDEKKWNRIAGNRYMYHNRLQVDDFIEMFRKANLNILYLEPTIDEESLEALRKGLLLDSRFRNKSTETLATSSAWFVAAYQ